MTQMSRIRNKLVLFLGIVTSALLVVQYLRLLQPAQARAVRAACNGMRPSSTNPIFGEMTPEVMATDFSLLDQNGERVTLSEFRGKIVVVNFWASWCSVCRSEKPSLEEFQEDTSGDDVVVLALASDRDWSQVKRAMLGFEVATAEEVLRKPEIYGIRDASKLAATGKQIVVARVDRGRTAHANGLRRLDRILSVNGSPVETMDQLDIELRKNSNSLTLEVLHKGSTQTLKLSKSNSLRVLLDLPDDEGNLGAVAKKYGITAVPESFVVDREGKIRYYFINKRNWKGDVADTCLQDLIDE